MLGRYVRYLTEERGLTEEQIEHFDVSMLLDGLWWLVGAFAFPLYDPVYPDGYVFRKRKGGYANPGIESDAIYNARVLEESGKVYVVEGPMDCIRLYPQFAVATLGKDISEERLDRLSTVENDLVIALDGDAWVYAQATCNQLQLRGKTNVSWVKLSPGCDPGELGCRIFEYEEIQREAR